jgi:hypothetical protein
MEPTYVSGRSRMCSSCVFFWYVCSIVLLVFLGFLALGGGLFVASPCARTR